MSTHLFLIFIDVPSDPAKTAYAYRNCSLARNWAEKADYSECLNLISEIPNYEVSQVKGEGSKKQKEKSVEFSTLWY